MVLDVGVQRCGDLSASVQFIFERIFTHIYQERTNLCNSKMLFTHSRRRDDLSRSKGSTSTSIDPQDARAFDDLLMSFVYLTAKDRIRRCQEMQVCVCVCACNMCNQPRIISKRICGICSTTVLTHLRSDQSDMCNLMIPCGWTG